MNPDSNQQVRDLFDQAILLQPEDWQAFLDSRVPAGPVRDELESLLSHHAAPSCFLEEPFRLSTAGGADPTWIDQENTRSTPQRIGAYRIIEQVGSGGMGIVYRAEQDNPKRSVALKVIRSGISSRTTLQRFGHEAEALGRLQHPGIAQIFEAGTADAGEGPQPYFAMEFVRGVPLTQFVKDNKLSVRDRLGLLARVCDAIHHAHQRGVIHRDIKPDNILVEPQGQPRVLDFGIARVLDADHRVSLDTQSGQLLGTLAYMSPEQIAGDPNAIDIRTDVYALGLIGFELLSGTLPYDLAGMSLQAALQTVQATEVPTLESLDRTYRGDVSTIIAKAVAKPKDRRYASVSDLAADIRRALNDEPITARPPTTMYQLTKLARKHRALVTSACVVIVVLVLGIAGTTFEWFKARAAEQRALSAAETAGAVTTFLEDMLSSVDPAMAKGEDTTVLLWMLDDAARTIDAELGNQPTARASVQSAIGAAYKMIGRFEEAEPHLRGALQTHQALDAEPNGDLALSMVQLGSLQVLTGTYDEAESLFRDGLAMLRILEPNSPAVADTLFEVAVLHLERSEYQAGEKAIREALALWEALFKPTSPEVARGLHGLGRLREAQSDYSGARELYERALSIKQTLFGDMHPQVLSTMNNLAAVVEALGDHEAAEARYTQVLAMQRQLRGNEHPNVATACKNLASAVDSSGDHARAESLYREAIDIYRVRLDPEHPMIISTLDSLGVVLRTRGDYFAARQAHEESLLLLRKRVGPEHVRVAAALNNLAGLLREMDQLGDAATAYDEVLGILKGKVGPEHQYIAATLNNMAALEEARGDYERAELLCRDALDIWKKNFGDKHPHVVKSQQNLAAILAGQGQHEVAEPLFRAALAGRREMLGPDHADVAVTCDNLGSCLQELARFEEAEPLHLESLRIRIASFGKDSYRTAHSLHWLGMLCLRTGRANEAESYFRRTLDCVIIELAPDHTRVINAKRLLGKALAAQGHHEAAEALLLEAHDASTENARVREALVELYEAWNKPSQAERHKAHVAPLQNP
jgi:serine/threonine protein kinase/tetratricopeptide (TPR) repeat protein